MNRNKRTLLLFSLKRSKLLCLVVLGAVAACFCSGCASGYAERLRDVRRDYYDYGNLEQAKLELQRRQKRAPQKEKDVLALNEASLELCSGNIAAAKEKLIQARDSFDIIEDKHTQKSAENLFAYWTDDNMNSYEGEDYEKVLVRATLAIADLFDGSEDARAYAYQIAAKQDEIVQNGYVDDPRDENKKINPKKAYPRIPLGPYLEGLLWEETYLNASDAARCYEKVVKWRPDFKQGKRDLVRAQTSVHSQPGNGRVYVFAFVGRGPYKEQVYEEATQFALLFADHIFSSVNKYSVPPTLAPVPVPMLVVEEPYVKNIGVDVDGERTGVTETIADVNEMATKQYEAIKDQILAKAIVRRVVKKGAIYAAKEVGQVNDWVSIAMDVGGIVWEAAESADTRCWGLLPAKIQVASFEVPIGEHELTVCPCDPQGNKIGVPLTASLSVNANRNTYVLVNYPNREPIGTVVVSK
jgi:hypothetical protein